MIIILKNDWLSARPGASSFLATGGGKVTRDAQSDFSRCSRPLTGEAEAWILGALR